MSFAYPWVFLAIIPLILLLLGYIRDKDKGGLVFSDLGLWKKSSDFTNQYKAHVIPFLRFLCLFFLIFAAARPQTVEQISKKSSDGLDILLTIDTSRSMSEGIPYGGRLVTRLDATKDVVAQFVDQRIADRVGLVVFGEQAFTQAPLTLDHDVLNKFIDNIYINMAGPGTSIGPAIATSVKRLKGLEVKSKIVILLTDGRDSGKDISPKQAAEAAKVLGVKVYTVGIGSAPQTGLLGGIFGRSQGSELDEESLKDIANITGGQYFRADSGEDLKAVYEKIDQLETSKVEVKDFSKYHEEGAWFLILALALFFLEQLMGLSPWRVLRG